MNTDAAKAYLYAVCPHCEHPNIHVHDGVIAEHFAGITGPRCIGSFLEPVETHVHPLNRHTEEFRAALEHSKGAFREPADVKPIFETWTFCGIRYLSVPVGQNVHIVDALGGNYGTWMSVDAFRARQQKGVLADWSQLGKAYVSIVCDR